MRTSNFLQIVIVSAVTSSLILGLGYWYLTATNFQLIPDATPTQTPVTSETLPAEQTVPDVVETTIPAVASIVITADVPVVERYYENFWSPFGGLQVPRERQVGTERQEIGGGTGFFVSADGYLVTNRHVVDQENVDYSVVTNGGETYDATVVAKDPTQDVAILKVESDTEFPFLTFADIADLRLGQPVIAIGNALAEFPNSVSVGVVSGLSRNIVARDGFRSSAALEGVIQTDAAINRGNSGGPLLNTNGEVVGVNVAVAGGGENIGFALPSNMVQSVYDSVAEYGEIVRPFLGVRYLQITPDIAERNNLPVDYGVLVIRGETRGDLAVIPGSPADQAGISENDIILAINGQRLNGAQSLASQLRTYDIGDMITLTVLQDGEESEVTVTLEQE